MGWRGRSGCGPKPPSMILSYGGQSSAAASWRNIVVVFGSHVSWWLTQILHQKRDCIEWQGCYYFTSNLLLIFWAFDMISVIHKISSSARLKQTWVTISYFNSRWPVAIAITLSPCCCHDEIRLHSRGQMSNVGESEHWALWFFHYSLLCYWSIGLNWTIILI